jgi:hypothetical protein
MDDSKASILDSPAEGGKNELTHTSHQDSFIECLPVVSGTHHFQSSNGFAG